MVEEVRQIQTLEPPEWMRRFLVSEGQTPGILDEASRLYTAGLGMQLPQYEVAARTPFQTQAAQMAAAGIGSYMPMLQAGAYTLGEGIGGIQGGLEAIQRGFSPLASAEYMTREALMGAQPYQDMAAAAYGQAIPMTMSSVQLGQQLAAQGREDLGAAAGQVLGAGARGELAAAGGVRGITEAANLAQMYGAQGAGGLSDLATRSAQLGTTALGTLPQYGERMEAQGQRTAENILRAAGTSEEASRAAQAAIAGGLGSLAGTSGRFTPDQISSFMSDYETAAVDQALQDIARAGQGQRQQLGAQAVGAGAFGGSRQAVAEQELSRNVMEQQGRTAAQMRAAGYESAAQRAQTAFENALSRQLQGAQLAGSLGQAGANVGMTQAGQLMQGAQAAGQAAMQGTQAGAVTAQAATQLGLGAFGQAGQQAGMGAQLGMQGAQTGMAGAGQAAQTGLAGAQFGAQTAQTAGQMGAQGAQLGMQGAQMGMAGAGQIGQLGQGLGSLGAQYGQLGLSGAGQMAALSGQYGNLAQGMGALGQGLGGLGMQQAALGEAFQGLNLNDINTLLSIGAQEQTQRQTELDAARQNIYQQQMLPYQMLGYYSDIYQGMPSAQQSILQTQSPSPSMASQIAGLNMGLYSMNRAYQ